MGYDLAEKRLTECPESRCSENLIKSTTMVIDEADQIETIVGGGGKRKMLRIEMKGEELFMGHEV